MSSLTFQDLTESIRNLHEHLSNQARHAINVSLTLRNWLIGWYIAEYQLNGADRAKYGDKLIQVLATKLQAIPNCNRIALYGYLAFYKAYPKLLNGLKQNQIGELYSIVRTVFLQLATDETQMLREKTTTSMISAENQEDKSFSSYLLSSLSYNHFVQLVKVSDKTARRFYETECLLGNWSVRELKRQIGTMFYERTALSFKKENGTRQVNNATERDSLQLTVRDPYVFDFLGLKWQEFPNERKLEGALLDKLQEFLLELGRGFCFEARQKRILIGDEYFSVDLVFYHRILKCHILIDLKDEPFSHENIGQLNSYVAYYRKHKMTAGDNPPVGILLCTQKNSELVEYALAGMNQQLFVSQYLLQLPGRKEMEEFIRLQRDVLEKRQITFPDE